MAPSAHEALDFCVEHDLRAYISWGTILLAGSDQVRHGAHCDGLELMRAGIAGMDKINFRVLWTAHLGHFAWALGAAGEVKEGLDVLSKALLAVDQSGDEIIRSGTSPTSRRPASADGILEEAEAEYERPSRSHGLKRPSHGNSAHPPVSRDCASIKGAAHKLWSCSGRSTRASRKD